MFFQDNPDYKYRPQRKSRTMQKRPRPLPAPVPVVPKPNSVLQHNKDIPFSIPIIGITSARAYTIEEFQQRLQTPHTSPIISEFTILRPPAPKPPVVKPPIRPSMPCSPAKLTGPNLVTVSKAGTGGIR